MGMFKFYTNVYKFRECFTRIIRKDCDIEDFLLQID